MSAEGVGILHPGAMGASIGAAARKSGRPVLWVSQGRSTETGERAERAGLEDAGSLEDLAKRCGLVVSVCPPAFAVDVARQVAGCGFSGLYVDANAVSPQRTREAARTVEAAGARFVDGGIVGPPAWKEGTTRLYLSGPGAEEAAAVFDGSLVRAVVLHGPAGRASALKMTYAAYTKGTTALVGAILAVAEREGVREALMQEWSWSQPHLADDAEARVRRTTAKAWRFVGEMREIAATFEAAGLPGGFHRAAETVYKRQAGFKGLADAPELDQVLAAMLGGT